MESALRREIKKEIAFSVRVLFIAGLWLFQRSAYQFLTGAIFIALADTEVVRLSTEHVDFRWVAADELTKICAARIVAGSNR